MCDGMKAMWLARCCKMSGVAHGYSACCVSLRDAYQGLGCCAFGSSSSAVVSDATWEHCFASPTLPPEVPPPLPPPLPSPLQPSPPAPSPRPLSLASDRYALFVQSDGLRLSDAYSDATVYYPHPETGVGAPPYKSIVMSPGFFGYRFQLYRWGRVLASQGYVCLILDTNLPYDFPFERGKALRDARITLLHEHGERTQSPLYGKLNTSAFIAMGHSMGGGGAYNAAINAQSGEFVGVLALTPWIETSVNELTIHDEYVLIIGGSRDTVSIPSEQARRHYFMLPSTTKKILYEVESGNHVFVLDPNDVFGAGVYALAWMACAFERRENECAPLRVTPETASVYNFANV